MRAALERRGAKALIEIDGGVNMENAKTIREGGVDLIVAGSAVFGAEDPAAAIEALRGA